MKLEITTPAILFPAISLLILAYTNKFLAISSIIRQLSSKVQDVPDENLLKQIRNLHTRINLLRHIQAQGLISILCCLISIIFLYSEIHLWGNIFFVLSIFFMMLSIALAVFETMISGQALKIQLKKISQVKKKKSIKKS